MAHLIVFDGDRPSLPRGIEDICSYGGSAYVVGGKLSGRQILEAFEACQGGSGPTAIVVKIASYDGCARTDEVSRLSDVLRS